MFLLINDKLYGKDNDKYKSIDIVNGQIMYNNIEERTDTLGGMLLTYSEVYKKFGINPSMPQMSQNYNFPTKPNTISTNDNTNDSVVENTEKPKSSSNKPKTSSNNKNND